MPETQSAFSLFHPKVQEWVYKEGWSSLNDAQVKAAFAIAQGDSDLVISAPTASGKTEAVFLPLISKLITEQKVERQYIFYVSPLKALINDQWQRLDILCESNNVDVVPWHGDISQSVKRKIETSSCAIILITPESMEAMLINRPETARTLSPFIKFIIIDEFHAFVGQPRGDQLVSLIERFSELSGNEIRRIALSATIGDKEAIATALNPRDSRKVLHIDSSQNGQKIKLRVTGFEEPVMSSQEEESGEDEREIRRKSFITYVASELFRYQNKTNLVFPNSRRVVEELADAGNQLCNQQNLERRFFAHHGFLSKEIREDVETSARKGEKIMTICCTSTLELGIDLGSVDTVFQITAPYNVSSLRQRLGRSGRRGSPPILRTYICESRLEKIKGNEQDIYLREGLIRVMACLDLIADNWYEPPDNVGISPSIAAHQILSMLAQIGGAHPAFIWRFLAGTKAYRLTKKQFQSTLRHLGSKGLIIQLLDGQIVLSERGENLSHSKDFYTVFSTPEVWRIYANGNLIASFPLSAERIKIQDCLLIASKRWSIVGINDVAKTVAVIPDKRKGSTPTSPGYSSIHTMIRRKMREIYCSESIPDYLDSQAKDFLSQARYNFREIGLNKSNLCQQEAFNVTWFPWVGTRAMIGLTLLIELFTGSSPTLNNGELSLTCPLKDLKRACSDVLKFSPDELRNQLVIYFNDNRPGIFRSDSSKKWLWLIPDELVGIEFIDDRVDVSEAISSLKSIAPMVG